jgi:hypothetical protein
MAFYRLGYQEALDLPVAVFWQLSRNVDRIQAESDLRAVRVAQTGHLTGEGIQAVGEALREEMGDVFVIRETLDREGLNLLKMMSL